MATKFGFSILGTFNRWRPEAMEVEEPGVYGFTVTLGETRWERFQIALDGDLMRVLHPYLPEAGRVSPAAGPEAALQILSWMIDGRTPTKPKDLESLAAPAAPAPGAKAIVPDSFEFKNPAAEIGDRFRVRLRVRGRWKMVDWERLPEEPDGSQNVKSRARAADFQVVGSWNLFEPQVLKPAPQTPGVYQREVSIPVDGEHYFHLLRNSDWGQAICPDLDGTRVPGSARISTWDQIHNFRHWSFRCVAGDVFRVTFQRVVELGLDEMKVSWEKIAENSPVPKDLLELHTRKKYFVKFQWTNWEEQMYQMHWTGHRFQLFIELNELAKTSFRIYEEGNLQRCIYPGSEAAELQGPRREPDENSGLAWTIGSEEDRPRPFSRYEIELHMNEGSPASVSWVPLTRAEGLEEAAARGFFVAWLPTAG